MQIPVFLPPKGRNKHRGSHKWNHSFFFCLPYLWYLNKISPVSFFSLILRFSVPIIFLSSFLPSLGFWSLYLLCTKPAALFNQTQQLRNSKLQVSPMSWFILGFRILSSHYFHVWKSLRGIKHRGLDHRQKAPQRAASPVSSSPKLLSPGIHQPRVLSPCFCKPTGTRYLPACWEIFPALPMVHEETLSKKEDDSFLGVFISPF